MSSGSARLLWSCSANSHHSKCQDQIAGHVGRLVASPPTQSDPNVKLRQQFASLPNADHWVSFAHVAKYVRILDGTSYGGEVSHGSDVSSKLHPSAWNQIKQTCPGPYALPSLQVLRTRVKTNDSLLLLSPSLVVLHLSNENDTFETPAVEAIGQMTTLRELKLEGFFSTPQQAASAGAMLRNLQALETITLTLPSASACFELFRSLSDAPNIKHVTLDLMCKSHRKDILRPDTQDELPLLQTLKLLNMCVAVAAALISTFYCGRMRELKLTLDGPYTQWDNNYLFADISDACPALQVLDIGRPKSGEYLESAQGPAIDYTAMKPIIDNLQLNHFSIFHELPLELDHAAVIELSRMWGPSIRFLSLNPAPDFPVGYYEPSSTVSFTCLQEIGRNCPHLTQLGIYVYGGDTPPPPISAPIFSAALTCINFGSSNVHHTPWEFLPFFGSLKVGQLTFKGQNPPNYYRHDKHRNPHERVFWEAINGALKWGHQRAEQEAKQVEQEMKQKEQEVKWLQQEILELRARCGE